MKRITRLTIVICLLILFLSCAQNKQNATNAVPSNQETAKNENTERKISVAEYHKISAEKAKKILDENSNALLLDVRRETEYKEKHITGAILFPVTEIKEKAAEKLPDKNALILVYCRSGVRSKDAANQLVSMGYVKVYDLGGIINWPYDTN